MTKLTEKQKQFLQKHNLWNPGKNKSTLGIFEEGQFKDFFRRKEKIEIELARLPDKEVKNKLLRRLGEAEDMAKNRRFKEAYRDLNQVKIDARRVANDYSASLSVEDISGKIDEWGLEGETLNGIVRQLYAGMRNVRSLLSSVGNASDCETLGEAAEFLRDFKQTEILARGQLDGLKVVHKQIGDSLRKSDPAKQLQDFGHQLTVLQKEHEVDVSDLRNKLQLKHVHYIYDGTTLKVDDLQREFDQFVEEIDSGIRRRKDTGKFQKREGNGEKIDDDTLMRNPTLWNDNPSELDEMLFEIAEGNPKWEFDNVMFELKDVELALQGEKLRETPEFLLVLERRRDKALQALRLLEERDEQRMKKFRDDFTSDSSTDDIALSNTKDAPKTNQPLDRFDVDSIVSTLKLPQNLKRITPDEIDQVSSEAKKSLEELLDVELDKEDSDLIFDLGLKTKEDFYQELAHQLGIDPKHKNCSKQEKTLLDRLATQMVATVREKYPDKAGDTKVTLETKSGKTTDVPSDFMLGGKKYVKPKYLASGGVGDVLRYEEEGSDPPKYTVVKTLQNQEKRGDMVHELKMHRQANGGEHGDSSPYVVEMEGAILGPNGEIYMAMEFADGGDLNDMGYTLAQATMSGAIPREAREVLTQHMLQQAILGMKQVQDNNMTHHDIKGMNYLIGGDGKVKVADFGSGQVGDEQGEVDPKAGHVITTAGYKAPEFDTKARITGKADTYSLGQMLNKLANPMQGHGAKGRVDEPVTAFDKLRVSMTDPDPDKRPTLESVLQTSYMTDVTTNYDPEKIEQMMQAVMAYNKHVANQAKKELRLIVFYEGEVEIIRKQVAAAKTVKERETAEEKLAAQFKEIEKLRQTIDKLMSREESKPYLERLKKASEEMLRPSTGPTLDVEKLKFVQEYQQIVKDAVAEADEKLLESLKALDLSEDSVEKKQHAKSATSRTQELIDEQVKLAKSSKEVGDKLRASKFATDLRRLSQVLKKLQE